MSEFVCYPVNLSLLSDELPASRARPSLAVTPGGGSAPRYAAGAAAISPSPAPASATLRGHMPEYQYLRYALAALQLCACVQIFRRRITYLAVFACCLFADALSNCISQDLMRSGYWRRVWLPLAIINLAMRFATSIDLFAFLRGRMIQEERRLLLAWAALVGALMIGCGWVWVPQNWFQGFATVRQYLMIGLSVGTVAAWVYVGHLRPVQLSANIGQLRSSGGRHLAIWCLWLALYATSSTTGASGLTWMVFEWKGGLETWRIINDACLVGQLGIAGVWVYSLRTKRERAPVVIIEQARAMIAAGD